MKNCSYLIFYSLLGWVLLVSCTSENVSLYDYGIKKELADYRSEHIKDVNYQLSFSIPDAVDEPIEANEAITFSYNHEVVDLILDFDVPEENVKNIEANGQGIDIIWRNNHLIVPKQYLEESANRVEIEFIAGDQSLNRQDDYLYTLFVPARASTCFPLMDQPDVKATFDLTLAIPQQWEALSNSEEVASISAAGEKQVTFGRTRSISSYLFAFAAGDFDIAERETSYGLMRMFHREPDSLKLSRNIDAVFDWHIKSLKWLEDYTAIEYPFPKFDFILLPSFQYGGMEHPGAVFYKASSLLLDENPTINQEIGRGRLIAHESAHIWFGDLVTMSWFDDVWLKEVFANFMAAKIINPSFPSIDHNLKFILGHYPRAYSVDRTDGTHAIAQQLDDLYNAGSLYGSIIYQKAPIVMRKLEQQIGVNKMQEGLREYLSSYQFDNASWDDLIQILTDVSDQNLKRWDQSWVKKKGMPIMVTNVKKSDNELKRITLFQVNGHKNIWQQQFNMRVGNDSLSVTRDIDFKDRTYNISGDSLFMPTHVFPNLNGDAYGYFKMGRGTRSYYKDNVSDIESSVTRAAVWMSLYENMIHQNGRRDTLMNAIISALPKEKEALIIEYLNNITQVIFWKFLTDIERLKYAAKLEGLLLNLALSSESPSVRSSYFKAFYKIALTEEGLNIIEDIWSDKAEPSQLSISENDKIHMAYQLSIKLNTDSLFKVQINRVTNPDKKKKLEFVLPAISPKKEIRDAFFESLKKEKNRQNEEWVLEALQYLHHPLRQQESVEYITPSLKLLKEIKGTGDIFFPKRWLDNTLTGHNSIEAADAVRQFLYANHDYPMGLKNKVLQSSDMLFRAEEILASKRAE